MRKLRDYDAELQALTDKAKTLKTKKQGQLGELVIACGADALSIEQLAGALLEAVGADVSMKEAWRKSGAAFFRGDGAHARKGTRSNAGGASASDAGAQSRSGETGAA
ncbi:conjugal transfer protein TraD [Sphingopyxis sp. Q841]|uniref:conjugal transfer protein TraD n=1 Tax=Sphingopyxis sp. Q841 TaxID=3458250 RepID=UPI0040365F95